LQAIDTHKERGIMDYNKIEDAKLMNFGVEK
jgi:hypothetical protein